MRTSHHGGTARAARLVADGLRVATLLSAVVVLIWLNGYGIPFVALFLILLAPRLLDVAAPFDAAFSATMLTATWARQQHWYVNVSWADEAVHAVTPGATAATVYLMLAKLDLLPDVRQVAGATRRFSLVLLVTFVGLGLATVWEFVEWVGEQYAPLRARTSDTTTPSPISPWEAWARSSPGSYSCSGFTFGGGRDRRTDLPVATQSYSQDRLRRC